MAYACRCLKIITGFICDSLRDTCEASTEAQVARISAEAATALLTGQKAADVWNGALRLTVIFNLTDIGSSSNTTGPSVPSTTSSTDLLQAASPFRNSSSVSTSLSGTAAAVASANLDLGSCSKTKIEFGVGFDGRTEESFQPVDKTEFNHGSADNIGIIASLFASNLRTSAKAVRQRPKNSTSPIAGESGTISSTSDAQALVTASSSGPSTATATSSVDEPDASTSPSNGLKANGQRKGQSGGKQRSNNDGNGTTSTGADVGAGNANITNTTLNLLASNVQSASDATGIEAQNAKKAQAASSTAPNNFINFCAGKALTNGQQSWHRQDGLADHDFPEVGKTSELKAHQTFQIEVQVTNLDAGSFTNPDTTYYAAPQQVKDGKIVGHTHVTVQDLGRSLTPKRLLDPRKFAFFNGINDTGDGKGGLSATVTGGLPAGHYRVCTLGSCSNHQPVLMPVAQRGEREDCQKFVGL